MGKRKRCGDLAQGDLIQEILVRLPVISLLRFKSVCKSWHTLIKSSFFIHLHTNNTFNSSSSSSKFGSFILLPSVDSYSPKYSGTYTESALVMLSSVGESQYDRPGVRCLITSPGYNDDHDHDQVFRLDSLGFPSYYKSYLPFSKDLGIIGSCNGLVCLYDRDHDEVSVCNLATRQFRILPKTNLPSEDDLGPLPTIAAFGFDVETKDYKVVLLTGFRADFYGPIPRVDCLCQVEVYSLRTNSWRILEKEQGGKTSLPGYPFSYPNGGISLNGSCFFLAHYFRTKHQRRGPENDRFIISFDFTKEIFTPIQLPDHHRDQKLYLSCLGDKLALFTVFYDPPLDASYPYEDYNIWVLNERVNNISNVNKKSWTKLRSFEIEHEEPGERNLPIGISDDGKFALLQTMGTSALFKKMMLYNLVTKEVETDFLTCDIVMSKANAYKPSLVSIDHI